jgi:tetratricopeptide (TPR) repeat protein
MKRFFGYSQTHVICNITLQSDSESLKITTQINRNVEEKNSSLENLDSIISDIAEYIYKCKEPFTLAYYYYVNGHPNECFESLKHCLQNNIFSDDHLAYNLLGRILYIQKNYDDAIKKYKMATRLHPKFAPAYYNWGLALHDKGLHDKAIVKYMKALEIDDRCAPAYFNLGLIFHTVKKDYIGAKEKYQMALKYTPRSARSSIYTSLGNISLDQESYNEAIEMYKKGIEINPLAAEVYCNLGVTLWRQKEYEKAIEELETAIEIKPLVIAYYTWGLALHDQQNYKDAIEKYKKTLEIDPRFASAYYYLGVALYNIGKYDEAIKNFQEFIELAPDDQLVDEAKRYINKLTEETEQDNGSVPK